MQMDRHIIKQWVHLWNYLLCRELIHEPTSAANEIQFKTSIYLLQVSEQGFHPQEDSLRMVFYYIYVLVDVVIKDMH
jgi:hypothetical protein